MALCCLFIKDINLELVTEISCKAEITANFKWGLLNYD